MSENLTPNNNPVEAQNLGEVPSSDQLQQRRIEFVTSMTNAGLISEAMAESGVLESFSIDETTGRDTLIHTLVGDQEGGFHHLPTAMALDQDIRAGTRIAGSQNISGGKLRRRQMVRDNGTYRAGLIKIGETDKPYGSAMFPNEWSAEDVINGALAVSSTPPTSYDQERGSHVHEDVVNGVPIRTVTSTNTGKILTAFPEVPKR